MRRYSSRGTGLLNRTIDALPVELHLPGYRFCGPGTKLSERQGQRGINRLDDLCRTHDYSYQRHKDSTHRNEADRELANKAWDRFKSKDTPFGEKAAAWFVTTAMNAKRKMGAGGKKKKRGVKKASLSFRSLMSRARSAIKGSGVKEGNSKRIRHATIAALKAIRGLKKNKSVRMPRVLPLPKSGGVLPLLPIFAGLSAIGSLAGGAAGVAKAVSETRDAKRKLAELQRHNETMEAIALRKGRGLFLKPHKKGGLGLYVTPYSQQAKNC